MITSEIEAVIRAAVEQTKRSIWLRPAVDPIPTDPIADRAVAWRNTIALAARTTGTASAIGEEER